MGSDLTGDPRERWTEEASPPLPLPVFGPRRTRGLQLRSRISKRSEAQLQGERTGGERGVRGCALGKCADGCVSRGPHFSSESSRAFFRRPFCIRTFYRKPPSEPGDPGQMRMRSCPPQTSARRAGLGRVYTRYILIRLGLDERM